MKQGKFNNYDLFLIENEKELASLANEVLEHKVFGVDVESTGLDFNKDQIVGVCISFGKPLKGYYLPVRHVYSESNLPLDQVLNLTQNLISNKKTMWFNRNYDFSMLEKEGVHIPFDADFHDVQPMCWMATNEGFPALKVYVKKFLKMEIIEFSEAAKDESGQENHNFGLTDPKVSFIYAANDPLVTVLLGRYMWNNYPYIRKIYPLDNRFTEAARLLGQSKISIDFDLVDKLLMQAEFELRDLRQQIFSITGYEFKLTSNRDKAEALSRFVTLTQKTEKGQFSVKDEVLQEIDHPLAKMLLTYSKKVKYISSYLKPLTAGRGVDIRFNYKTCDVPCLTKESTVLIKDKGVISVSDVKEGDFIWTRYGFKKVLLAEEYLHDCNLIKVNTFYGRSFTGTPWHPVMTESGWAKLKDLKIGDNLLMDIRQVQESHDLNFYKNYNYGRFYVDNLFKGEEFLQKVKPLLDDLYDRFGFTFVWDWVDKDNVSVRIKENDYKPFTRISCLWFLFGLISVRKSLRNPESLIKKALIACGFSNRNYKTIFDYDIVTTIEVVDPLPVYHIEVEDVHEYVSDGIVHHNTGRMACGSQRGNSYYFGMNLQSIPKVSKKRFIHPDPELGYCLTDEEEGSLGKQKVKAGLRDAFCVPKNLDGSSDYFFLTADYCIDPEALVNTNQGFMRVKDLEGKTGLLIETPYGFKEVYNFHYTGIKQKCVLKLKTGEEVICSPDHIFMTFSKGVCLWKQLKDIESSDIILTKDNYKDYIDWIKY